MIYVTSIVINLPLFLLFVKISLLRRFFHFDLIQFLFQYQAFNIFVSRDYYYTCQYKIKDAPRSDFRSDLINEKLNKSSSLLVQFVVKNSPKKCDRYFFDEFIIIATFQPSIFPIVQTLRFVFQANVSSDEA